MLFYTQKSIGTGRDRNYGNLSWRTTFVYQQLLHTSSYLQQVEGHCNTKLNIKVLSSTIKEK